MGMTRKKTKSPPFFSHEFVIQNHADILACFAILIVMGLMSEKTANTSRLFVFLQYGLNNGSTVDADDLVAHNFARGILDIFTVIFAAVILAIAHALIQEYAIDKMSKKLHLSKTKNSKFNESGQLTVWWLLSTFWGIFEIFQSGFIPHIGVLWKGYPHTSLEWSTKIYFICQIGYWLHMYPELYLQKVKKEELLSRLQYYTLHFVFIVGAYMLHFWRICLFLLTLHSMVEAVFHTSRMFHYADKSENARYGFMMWEWTFPAVRFVSLTFSFLTFLFGLNSVDKQGVDFLSGCYNSIFIRLVCLVAMCSLQGWLMWNFIHLRARKSREEAEIQRKIEVAEAVTMKSRLPKKPQKKSDTDEQSNTATREKMKLKKN